MKARSWTRACWRPQLDLRSSPPALGPSGGHGLLTPGEFLIGLGRRWSIARVVWHQQGHRIEVIYDEGDPDLLEGDESIVSTMAENEGL